MSGTQSSKALASFKVLDLGVGMDAALTAVLLGHCGAEITRIEPQGGDPFYGVYPAYQVWRRGAKLAPADQFEALMGKADVCILGGEDWPGLDRAYDAKALAARHPRLVVLDLTAYSAQPLKGRPAVDLLVQARTGLSNEQSAKRPIAFAFPMPTYGAALIAAAGVMAALIECEHTDRGQVVETSLEQGLGAFMSAAWIKAQKPTPFFTATTPKDVKPLTFRCADGDYVNILFGTPGSLYNTYKVLGIDIAVEPSDRGMPDVDRPPENYLGDRPMMAPFFARQTRDQLLEGFWKAGVAADAVLRPGEAWDSEQVQCNAVIATDAAGWRSVGRPFAAALKTQGAAKAKAPVGRGPLAGVRVLDLGNWVAGPHAAKLLADLGADAIKVEGVEGDPHRLMYRSFASSNRGKRSLAVDLKTPEGVAIVQRLAATADAANHNLRLGVAERIGIGDEDLRRANPGLVNLHTTAYGATGPKAYFSGWDPIMQPYCGHAIRGGGEGNDTVWYMSPIVDYGTGALNAVALLKGLYDHARTGCGQTLGTNLLDTSLFLMSELVQSPDGAFQGAETMDADICGLHPAERLYQAKDGWIAVAARGEEMAAAFAGALGLDLGPRAGWGVDARARLETAIRAREAAPLLAALDVAGVWAEPVVTDGFADLRDRDGDKPAMLMQREEGPYGTVWAIGSLFNLSRWGSDTTLKPFPEKGEHTRAILGELGYSAAEVEDFFARRIVAEPKVREAVAAG